MRETGIFTVYNCRRGCSDGSTHKGGRESCGGSRRTLREHRNATVVVLDRVLVGDLKEHMQYEMDLSFVDFKPFGASDKLKKFPSGSFHFFLCLIGPPHHLTYHDFKTGLRLN